MSDKAKILLSSATEPNLGPEGHRARLRERFMRGGLASLADYEVVELILTLAIPRRDVKPTAKALIARFKTLRGIMDADRAELARVHGMGDVAAAALKIIRASAEAYLGQSAQAQVSLNNYAKLEEFWRMRMGGLTHEVVEVAYLDAAYHLLPDGVERLEEGSVDETSMSLQKLFKRALGAGARFLVLAHNHPTGELIPSEADTQLTERVATAARALELDLLDHWIISATGSYSFRKSGKL
jgi:DNA repair protein RadC